MGKVVNTLHVMCVFPQLKQVVLGNAGLGKLKEGLKAALKQLF